MSGQNVSFNAVNLPALQGTTTPVQLPVAVVGDKFCFASGANVTINGLVVTSSSYEILAAADTAITVNHLGKLIAKDVLFDPRTDWSSYNGWWSTLYSWFNNQKNDTQRDQVFPLVPRQPGAGSHPAGDDQARYHYRPIPLAQPAKHDLRGQSGRRRFVLGPVGLGGEPIIEGIGD